MMPRDQERQGNRFGEPAAKEKPFANRSRTWTGDLFERIITEKCNCEGGAALDTTSYRNCSSFLRKEREDLNWRVIKIIESSETQKSSPSGNIEVMMSSNISIWILFFFDRRSV